jgi:asparagine synthase (glutamine-hydrolysing)
VGLREDLLDLVWHQEEPFGSTSIYAQWEVFKLAKHSGVTVTLDGQGSDELLAGYHHYFYPLFSHLIISLQWLNLISECWFHTRLHDTRLDGELLNAIWLLLPQNLKRRITQRKKPGDKSWLNREFVANQAVYSFRKGETLIADTNVLDQHLYRSLMTIGLPALLRYEDRNSMAWSIESRVPFLDYRLVEFAFELPLNQKIRRGTTKFILRNAMNGLIPESIAKRQDKIGFSTPQDEWFRTDMREVVLEIIDSASFRQRPFFDTINVKEEFESHQRRQRNVSSAIWRWLNLELWLRMFIDRSLKS